MNKKGLSRRPADQEKGYLRRRLLDLPKSLGMRTHPPRDIFDAIF